MNEQLGKKLELNQDEKISIDSLAGLTGFPADFIKRELLLEASNLSLNELRERVATYLEGNLELLKS